MTVFLTIMPEPNESKSWMRVEKVRVCVRVFLTFIPGQARTKVDELTSESLQESFLMSWSNEKNNCDKTTIM